MSTQLRKEIEEILYSNLPMTLIKEENKHEAILKLLQLFKKTCLEVIGEEERLPQRDENGSLFSHDKVLGKNELREEQRQTLKKIIK